MKKLILLIAVLISSRCFSQTKPVALSYRYFYCDQEIVTESDSASIVYIVARFRGNNISELEAHQIESYHNKITDTVKEMVSKNYIEIKGQVYEIISRKSDVTYFKNLTTGQTETHYSNSDETIYETKSLKDNAIWIIKILFSEIDKATFICLYQKQSPNTLITLIAPIWREGFRIL
ncbi:MAG: hypothetical protein JST94_00855 [Bacteroidetes bacterium]|nr:hypothetical protein [Bacteroidota bacterium]MBS1670003.1 hypothetical protein [Bacteroidota bacterium]